MLSPYTFLIDIELFFLTYCRLCVIIFADLLHLQTMFETLELPDIFFLEHLTDQEPV